MKTRNTLITLSLSSLLILLCGRKDTIYNPDPERNGITIEAFGIDTTGIIPRIVRDSLTDHLKSALQLLAGQPDSAAL
jgi:hypothetical protein